MNWTDTHYPPDHPRAGEPVDPVEAWHRLVESCAEQLSIGDIPSMEEAIKLLNFACKTGDHLAALCEGLSSHLAYKTKTEWENYGEAEVRRRVMVVLRNPDGTPVFPRREGER